MSDCISPENVSRFSSTQFRFACREIETRMEQGHALVLHFTSPENMQKILAPESKGVRASNVGQLGGGLSVVVLYDSFLREWKEFGAHPWPEKVGCELWGEHNGTKVLLGNPDHKFIECVLILEVPKLWVDDLNECGRVPGRPYVRILPPDALSSEDDGFYLKKKCIKKAYDLRPAADEMARQMIRKQLSLSQMQWSALRAEALDLGVTKEELRVMDSAYDPRVECLKRLREMQVELFSTRGATKLMSQDYGGLRDLALQSGARDSLVRLADNAGPPEDRKRVLVHYLLGLPATPKLETLPTPSTTAPSSRASSVSSRLGGTSRHNLMVATFELLDQDHKGLLSRAEMRHFAVECGFVGHDSDWAEEFDSLCLDINVNPSRGVPWAKFAVLLDDQDAGLHATTEELEDFVSWRLQATNKDNAEIEPRLLWVLQQIEVPFPAVQSLLQVWKSATVKQDRLAIVSEKIPVPTSWCADPSGFAEFLADWITLWAKLEESKIKCLRSETFFTREGT